LLRVDFVLIPRHISRSPSPNVAISTNRKQNVISQNISNVNVERFEEFGNNQSHQEQKETKQSMIVSVQKKRSRKAK
jgi:hypothetical protein